MLWSGIVYRNNQFGKTGQIDVMLYQKYNANGVSRDYSVPIHEQSDKNIKDALGIGKSTFSGGALTCKCLVLSGYGNGMDSGSFSLPQVGTVGLVAEIGDKERFNGVFYVWLGGLYGNKQFGIDVTLPSDDTITDELEEKTEEYITETSIEGEVKKDTISDSEYVQKGAYIIKTKTNKIDDYKNIDVKELEFKNILPENTFALTQDKAVLRHDINNYDDKKREGIEQLYFDKGKVALKRKLNKDNKLLEQDLLMDDSGITISLVNEDEDSKITVNLSSNGDVEVTTTGNLKVSTEGKMDLNSKEDMTIKTDGNVLLEAAKKMQIKASGQSFGVQVDNLAQAVATLTTQGSPAAQAATPDTVGKATNVSTTVAGAFEG